MATGREPGSATPSLGEDASMPIEDVIRAYLQGRMDRREFIGALRTFGVTVGAAIAYAQLLGAPGTVGAAAPGAPTAMAVQPPLALANDERETLEAVAARILPSTHSPGAREAGAANYVDIALAGDYAPSLPRYQRGLGQLDAYARASLGAPFAALSEADQDAVLRDLEAGQIEEVESGAEFFELMRRHILEGVFCEPVYGGNRDLVGWALVGFPGQRYGYPDPYINRVVDLPPVAVDGPPRPEL